VQQASYDAEASRLREELNLIKQRDQQKLGAALAAGEPGPSRRGRRSRRRSTGTSSAQPP
jgi:hypothetical protein